MNVVNLTQHLSTTEQQAEGVFDLPEGLREKLVKALTFSADYSRDDLEAAAEAIIEIVKEIDCYRAMVGGMPAFMAPLERALIEAGVAVGYARSERVSVDQVQADGTVRKTAIFKHVGMYWASERMFACCYCGSAKCIAYTHGESICG